MKIHIFFKYLLAGINLKSFNYIYVYVNFYEVFLFYIIIFFIS
jgi:hypothetical protein